ncbi:MAG: WG repeat-containing protein [Prevotella sp.]|nr:WG repeat-containing protein [Prevotella sp.]
MQKKAINVKMHSVDNCQEVINEIEKEYWGSTGINEATRVYNAWYVEQYNKNLKETLGLFDHISNALHKSCYHIVQKGTRFGMLMVSSSGRRFTIIIPIEYVHIIPLAYINGRGSVYMALNEEFKWGIPKTISWYPGNEILPFEFDDINPPTDDFYPVKLQGKWGLYYALKKDMAIEPQYEDAIGLSEGLLAVKKDGKWGFVDIFNHVVIPFEYESVSSFRGGYSLAIKYSFMENEGSVLLDHCGNETFFKNHKLADNEYRSKIKIKESYDNHNRYYYAIGPDEEIVIPKNKYRYLGGYREGLLAASLDGETYGYIDINEKVIIPFQYQIERYPSILDDRGFHFGLACVKLNNSKYSRECVLINHHNEQVFPYTFHSDILRYSNGRFETIGWSEIGERFKHNQISLYDIICCEKGKDMSYLIRTDAEIEVERRRKKRQREMEEPYQWTEEDTWDVMTDGMYGDYPGGDIDYEVLGF